MLRRQVAIFLVRRLGALVGVMLVLSILIFGLLYLAPGSPIDVLLGTRQRNPAVIAALNEQYHLHDSFWSQYFAWLTHAAKFDFGESIANQAPVTTVLGRSLAVTLPLGLIAFILTMTIGVGMGIAAALKRHQPLDRVLVGVSIVGISAPAFATGLFLLYVFGVMVKWFPVYGTGEGAMDRLYHLVLPALALSLTGIAFVVKLTRASMISALEQDYVVFARARGLKRRTVILTYALRNALVPVITTGGIVLGGLLTGTVIIESTFSLPGLGQLLVQSVANKDIPVVQAVALLAGAIIVLANLMADLAYLFVDPRMRTNKNSGGN